MVLFTGNITHCKFTSMFKNENKKNPIPTRTHHPYLVAICFQRQYDLLLTKTYVFVIKFTSKTIPKSYDKYVNR